jgi:alpha/beta hydrolase fold
VYFPDTRSPALTSSTMARKALPIAAGVVVAAVASALLNRWLAQKAERRNPPIGRFITVEGVRLHYVERGTGTALILLHGNGSMIQDFQCSGLIDLAAKKYRVIAFDRPGFGHSDRPRSTIWTPEAQADLIGKSESHQRSPRMPENDCAWHTDFLESGGTLWFAFCKTLNRLSKGKYRPCAGVQPHPPFAIGRVRHLLSRSATFTIDKSWF